MGYSPWGCIELDMTERFAVSLSSSDCLSPVFPDLVFTFLCWEEGHHPAQSLEKRRNMAIMWPMYKGDFKVLF